MHMHINLQGFGFLHSIAFIVSAISSCIIRSKMIKEARETNQPAPVEGTAPSTTCDGSTAAISHATKCLPTKLQ